MMTLMQRLLITMMVVGCGSGPAPAGAPPVEPEGPVVPREEPTVPDVVVPDVAIPEEARPEAPKWIANPCHVDADCGTPSEGGTCVAPHYGGALICTMPCDEGACPAGLYCGLARESHGPPVCLPKFGHWPVCLPCETDEDCLTGSNYCVLLADADGTPEKRCSGYPAGEECPEGLNMQAFQPEGSSSDIYFLCAPASGTCSCFNDQTSGCQEERDP